MNILRHIIIICTTLLMSISVLLAADIKATVNTKNVIEGDSFQLTLITDGDTDMPDLTPLEKDFIVLGTSQSTSFKNFNGNVSKNYSWILTLSPKKKGSVMIPSIIAGSVHTQPIEITVTDVSSASKLIGSNSGVNVTTRLNGNGDKFYQFQEIPLTVRIEISSRVNNLQLSEPAIADLELQQVGQDRNSRIIRNGQQIEIIERDYIIRPQKLGKISLPPFALRGVAPDPSYRDPMSGFNRGFDDVFNDPFFNSSPFGSRQRGKPFVRPSNSITFEVSANPNTKSDEWFLPAEAVSFDAQWQPDDPTFKKGEAVARVIRLRALGARKEQLPKLKFENIDGAKIYIDKDATLMQQTAQGEQAVREVTISIVPTRSGEVSLPQMEVKWLNTKTDESMTAILPAVRIMVEGDTEQAMATPTLKQKESQSQGVQQSEQKKPDQDQRSQALQKKAESQSVDKINAKEQDIFRQWWLWGLIVGSAVILCIIVWLINRRKRSHKSASLRTSIAKVDKQDFTATDYESIKNEFSQACKNCDTKALYQAILHMHNEVLMAKESKIINTLKTKLEKLLFAEGVEQKSATMNFTQIQKDLDDELNVLKNKKVSKVSKLPPLYK